MKKNEGLLKKIVSSAKPIQAPTKTLRDSGHVEFIVGIGKDNHASIIMTKDALLELSK